MTTSVVKLDWSNIILKWKTSTTHYS